MVVNGYKCDVCGVVKGEANHWFRACCHPGLRISIVGWDFDGGEEDTHLCGRDCVTRWLHQQFAEAR